MICGYLFIKQNVKGILVAYEIGRRKVIFPEVVMMLNLHGPVLRLLQVLLSFANQSMIAYPGRDTILLYFPGMDRRNLSKVFRKLFATGYVERKHIFDPQTGEQRKNAYLIKLPSVKKIIADSRREKYATRGVKTGGRGVLTGTSNIGGTKTKNLKKKRTPPPEERRPRLRSFDRITQKLQRPEESRRVLDRFKENYGKKTGNKFVEFPRHLPIMDSLCGALSEPESMATVDAWFEPGPHAQFARERFYKIENCFERSLPEIHNSDAYQSLKRKHEREWCVL